MQIVKKITLNVISCLLNVVEYYENIFSVIPVSEKWTSTSKTWERTKNNILQMAFRLFIH